MEHTGPLPRVTGTEMEWGGMVSPSKFSTELKQVPPCDFMPAVDECLYKQDITYVENFRFNYYMSNGARFYNDVGDAREYATPEDDSFIGTTANEIVSEKLFGEIADLHQEITGQQISFTKRVIADDGKSRGYHASYAVSAERVPINDKGLALYGVFAATRAVLFGSGALLPNGHFAIAQKTLRVESDFFDGTTSNKPVVNLRREPLANGHVFARVHDTSGDPTMSPWATRTKLGAASVVLRMIENGIKLESLRFEEDLFMVARKVAYDSSLTQRFRLISGESVTALDVQDRLVRKAQRLADNNMVRFSEEELWSIDEWDRALKNMRQDPRLTVDRVDWTMRRAVLDRQHERHGWGWNSQRLRYKDRQFSEVAIDGIALALRETRWAKYMPPESLIKDRMQNPPDTTRARVRGAFIRHVSELGLEEHSYVDWAQVGFIDKRILLQNPYQSRDHRVDKLLARLTETYGPLASY